MEKLIRIEKVGRKLRNKTERKKARKKIN